MRVRRAAVGGEGDGHEGSDRRVADVEVRLEIRLVKGAMETDGDLLAAHRASPKASSFAGSSFDFSLDFMAAASVFGFSAGFFIRRAEHATGDGDAGGQGQGDQREGHRHAATIEIFTEQPRRVGLRWTTSRHREPAGLHPTSGRKLRDDFKQMPCVRARPHAAGQNQIIARSLAFHRKTPGGEPREWVEPMQSTRELRLS